MAIAVTNKLATGSAVAASSYATASVSLTSGRFYLLTVRNSIGAGTATLPTVSGASATWTQVTTLVYSGNARRRTTVFRSAPGTGSGALTISFGGTNQSDCDWILDEFTGVNTSGTNGANAIIQSVTTDDGGVNGTSLSVTLATFKYSGNAAYATLSTASAPPPITPKSGYTETGETTAGGAGLEAEFKASSDTTPSWTFSSGAAWAGIGHELQAEPVSVTAALASGTGTANAPGKTVKPTAGVASGTGTANTPTISNTPPPRSFTIDSVDWTAYLLAADFSIVKCANRGQVGVGGCDIKDVASALTVPAMKSALFDEPAAGGSNKRVFNGFTQERSTAYYQDAAQAARRWAVELVDHNILWTDDILTDSDSADRPAETDYARMTWLMTTSWATSNSIGTGVMPNSNTVTLEATDYRGRHPADVAAECSEAASKLHFIYDYGAGRKVYYDVATGTSLTSTAKISDQDADTDGSTVFAPVAEQAPVVKKSPDRIYSGIWYTYNGGTVHVTNATTATNYRKREASVLDMTVTDATLAAVKANALLAAATAELTEIQNLVIKVPKANINDIREGQRIQVKLARHGISSYTYFRILQMAIQNYPGNTSYYLVGLQLASDVLPSANGGRGHDDIPQNLSNANSDGANVIVDRGGITVTDGAITVSNAGAVVIIDGSSDMFKIAASGSQSKTQADNSGGTASTTLAGLGTLAACPIVLATHSTTNVSTSPQSVGLHVSDIALPYYAALISGGSPTFAFVAMKSVGRGWGALDGSSHATVTISVQNESGGSVTYYQYYYVLQETAF